MKRIALFSMIISVFFTSCEDVLEKQPLNVISDATLWSDPVLMDDYLNQCYSEMRFFFDMPYGKNLNVLNANNSTDAISLSDECLSAWGGVSPKSQWITISGGQFEWWGYPTVRRLNIFIEKLDKPELTESYRKQRSAEARFLRAFAYFNMVKRYGGVPLITKVLTLDSPEEEIYPKRNREEEIYDFILSELDAITPDLPEVYGATDLGRPTRYAALALKSRAAMYAASIATWGSVQIDGLVGVPQNKASGYWQACYDASETIINSGKFALYNKYPDDKILNFRNLFLDEGNSEVIFSERYDGLSGKGHTLDMINVPMSYQAWGGGQKNCIYLEMIESFDNIDGTPGIIDRDKIASGYLWTVDELWGKKDPRFRASVYTHGTSWTYKNGPFILDYHEAILVDGKTVTSGSYKGVLARSQSVGRATNFGMLKYLDEVERAASHERGWSDTDFIIFRLGEIYLNYAEAAIELNKSGDALEAVNKIRERAGMPTYGSITRELVRKERKVELAFEGTRYFDVRRWRTAMTDLSIASHGLKYILDGNSYEQGAYDVLKAKYQVKIADKVDGTQTPYFELKHYYLPMSLSRTRR
ncbi:MAG: RagB/SusD family nutrient uptake outer membrane protein [Mangrovibacterium sp.]